MMHKRHIMRFIERAFRQRANVNEQLLHMLIAGICQMNGALFFIELKIFRRQFWHQPINRIVEIRLVINGPRDDQGRARLINQN